MDRAARAPGSRRGGARLSVAVTSAARHEPTPFGHRKPARQTPRLARLSMRAADQDLCRRIALARGSPATLTAERPNVGGVVAVADDPPG